MATTARDVGKVIATIPGRVGPTAGNALLRLVDAAIDGVYTLPSAKVSAARALQRKVHADEAVEWLIGTHVAMASAQGFATNVGGVVTSIIATPANITGVVVIQVRLVACIAHLRGYDIDDRRVRTAMLMCLLGDEDLTRQIASGRLPTSPMAVATAPVSDGDLDVKVAERIVADVMANVGGKRLSSFVLRKVPLIGGGIGAVSDGYGTHVIGQCAKNQLPSRRSRD
jgi:hypothetical protein